jgi:two-component system, LytTR family, response regulator
MTRKIRVLLVDDETLARERVRGMLAEASDVEIVGECADGTSAVEAIERDQPDLVFLDVQMPGLDGFEVIENLEVERMPAIIFVTAYDDYAIRAFGVHALDFLLKPFDRQRFEKALDHARQQIALASRPDIDPGIVALLKDLRAERARNERIVVKTSDRVFFVRAEEIDWVEAAGNYVKIHVKGEAHVIRGSMKAMESRLDPRIFVRIHRSTIVNVDRIKELEPWFHGEYIVIMQDGSRLTASRVFADRLTALMG